MVMTTEISLNCSYVQVFIPFVYANNLCCSYINKTKILINPLSAKTTKWSNTLKQFVGKQPTNCLSVFDHFMELTLKGLNIVVHHMLNKMLQILNRYKIRPNTLPKYPQIGLLRNLSFCYTW